MVLNMLIKSELAFYYCGLCVCLVLLNRISTGAKIKQRFNMEQLHKMTLRAVVPDNPVISMKKGKVTEAGRDVYETIQRMMGVFNITEMYVDNGESGVPDEYGNYTGLIGMVQRNETDLVLFMVRPDALPFEPVRIGAVYGSDEMVLLASRQPAKRNELDLAHLFSNFNELIYCYLAVCTYLVVVVSIVGLNLSSNWASSGRYHLFKWNAMLKHAYTYCWSILELLVDQENYNPISWANRWLWFSYCIVAFVLIFGFFTNLLSTDLVAFIKPPELHSLDDLFTPYFEPVQPVVITNLPSYSLIKHADPSTQLGALYQRLTRNTSISLMNVQLNDSSSMLSRSTAAHDGVISGRLCLATTDDLVTLLRLANCGFKPSRWSGAYRSATFAQGLTTSYSNKALPDQVSRFMDYKNRNLHELGVIGRSSIRTAEFSMAEILHEEFNWESFKCFHEMTDKEYGIEVASDIQLALSTAANVFQYTFHALGLAMLVLIVECLMHFTEKVIRRCKTRASSNSTERTQPPRLTRDAQRWASMQAQLTRNR